MAEHDATHGEHLGQVAQAQFVAQAPEHHERDDVGRILRPVQQSVGALVELLAARTAAEPAIALGGALGSLCHGFRAAFYTPHLRPPLRERRALYPPEPLLARDSGASPDRTLIDTFINEEGDFTGPFAFHLVNKSFERYLDDLRDQGYPAMAHE